jgi:hypothetical protein
LLLICVYNVAMPALLAVDLGLRTGLALYGGDGRLRRYGSHNFGSTARLRRGAPAVLAEPGDLEWVYIEGGGPLADIWMREAERRGINRPSGQRRNMATRHPLRA